MLNINDVEDKLIIDSMRNSILSYGMGIYPKFIVTDFAEGVANEIQDVFEGKNDRLILIGPPRHGKPLFLNTFLTYKDLDGNIKIGKHGDLKPGYSVLHHSGKWYNVVSKNDPIKMNVRVTFATGESFETHENHEWLVRDVKETRRARKNFMANNRNAIKRGEEPKPKPESFDVWKIIETKELLNDNVHLDPFKAGKRGSRYRYMTPRMKAAEFPETFQKIDPYWFGYWLGDGKSSEALIYVGKDDLDICVSNLSKIYKITRTDVHKDTNVHHLTFRGQFLEKHLPMNNKHIPEEYKLCSIEQRKQLLAGLIDSDGHVCQKTGRVRFVNTNKSIIDDVAWIARSLGWNAYITHQEAALSSSGVQGRQRVYTVAFNPDSDIPTIYDRKKIKIKKEASEIAIINAEMIPEDNQEDGFCIQVDSPDHTYVIGETFITTHNSLITSEISPAWFLGKYADRKIITASHTQDLADEFGAKVRDNMNNPLHEMTFGNAGCLSKGSRAAAGKFKTNAGGEYAAVGVGGTPIGKGADVYIIDDPIRNRADVESPKQREDLKSWYSSSVLSRLEGQGGIILMHQRWHDDDLAGYLLREHKDDGWRVVCFPALIENAEDKYMDYLDRDIGQPLVPELHSYDKLIRLRDSMLPRDWQSMYQGRPQAPGGQEFTEEMILRYEESPFSVRQGQNVYILVDPADSQNKYSDYTAMVVIGLGSDGNYYILDMVRERMDLKRRTQCLMELHREWRPLNVGYESYGAQADIQHINYVQGQENYRFPIIKLKTSVKKEERIRRVIPDMLQSRWYAPNEIIKVNSDGEKYNPLEDMIKDEMVPFPSGKHDDAIDALTRIYDMDVIWPSYNSGAKVNQSASKISPW